MIVRPASSPGAPSGEAARRARRRGNHKIVIKRRSALEGIAALLAWFFRGLLLLVRRVAAAAVALVLLAALLVGGRAAVRHVLESSRFAVRQVQVSATTNVPADVLAAISGVAPGDRLLSVDPDEVARRVARHPWVSQVRVRRKLPGTLVIDVQERRAAAVAFLGGLYLVDPTGRPFKQASTAEARGLAILTGLDRARYVANPRLVEAAFRQALALANEYRKVATRPALSEIAIDARFGFRAVLLDGATEVRLGRDGFVEKLARLDQILEAFEDMHDKVAGSTGAGLPRAVQIIHLDGAPGSRVAMRMVAGTT
jgi:cell division septal protein FtsQ